jgi:uroporphyrinogen-III synthase
MSLLAGVRVVVTRAEHQAAGLTGALEAAGATVAVLPLLEVVPPANVHPVERAASELALYDWLVLTSANAVAAFLPLTGGVLPARLKVAVVGDATARAVRAWDVEPALQPARADAEGLLAELSPLVSRSERVLLPQAADARPSLSEGLAAAGAEAVTVVAYDKRLPSDAVARARELFADQPLGWVTFTSPRIVRHFVEVLADDWARRKGGLLAASIGPVTSDALRAVGIEPAAEAVEPSDQGLVAAVVAAVIGRA